MKPIKIQIPKEMFSPAESISFSGSLKDFDPIVLGADTYTFPGQITWSIDITNTGKSFLIKGHVDGIAQTVCARCLEDATISFEGEIEGYFLENADVCCPDDIDADEFEILPDDKRIDILPLIHAAILLELPLVPVCRENCLGLCSQCGANLNLGDCDCRWAPSPYNSNNPFSVLADLDLN